MQTAIHNGPAPDDRIPGAWAPLVADWHTAADLDDAERVAMITHAGRLEAVANIHPEPEAAWRVAPSDWLRVLERAAVVLHSHPSGRPTPSGVDLAGQIGMGVPWIICPRGRAAFAVGIEDRRPLIGRGYRFGVDDCFAIFRSGFADFSGDWIPDFPRSWGFWKRGEAIFEDGVASAGFESVGEDINQAEKGDAILFRIRSEVFNHAAFYQGAGMMLHHPAPAVPFDPTRLSLSERVDRWIGTLGYEVFRRA